MFWKLESDSESGVPVLNYDNYLHYNSCVSNENPLTSPLFSDDCVEV